LASHREAALSKSLLAKLRTTPEPKAPSSSAKSASPRTKNFGYNADTGDYGDMVKMGVIDPAKVTRLALQNAAFHRGPDAHHRSAGCGTQGRRKEGCGGWRRSGWSGRRHGRHVLNLIRLRESSERAGFDRPAFFFDQKLFQEVRATGSASTTLCARDVPAAFSAKIAIL